MYAFLYQAVGMASRGRYSKVLLYLNHDSVTRQQHQLVDTAMECISDHLPRKASGAGVIQLMLQLHVTVPAKGIGVNGRRIKE